MTKLPERFFSFMKSVGTLLYGTTSVEVPITINLPKEYKIEDFDLTSNITLKYKNNINLAEEIIGEKNLYVKKQKNTNIYKIGSSKDTKRINRKTETMTTNKYELIMCCPGSQQLEKRLHKLYENKKIIGGGKELFKLDTNDINSLKDIFLKLRLENGRPKAGYYCCNKISKPKTTDMVYCNRPVDNISKDFCCWCLDNDNEDNIIESLYPFLKKKFINNNPKEIKSLDPSDWKFVNSFSEKQETTSLNKHDNITDINNFLTSIENITRYYSTEEDKRQHKTRCINLRNFNSQLRYVSSVGDYTLYDIKDFIDVPEPLYISWCEEFISKKISMGLIKLYKDYYYDYLFGGLFLINNDQVSFICSSNLYNFMNYGSSSIISGYSSPYTKTLYGSLCNADENLSELGTYLRLLSMRDIKIFNKKIYETKLQQICTSNIININKEMKNILISTISFHNLDKLNKLLTLKDIKNVAQMMKIIISGDNKSEKLRCLRDEILKSRSFFD